MYYLYSETFFRGQFADFTAKWRSEEGVQKSDLFVFGTPKTGWPALKESFYQIWSLSIWPFYGFLMAVVLCLLAYTYYHPSVSNSSNV
jgi:hypothetical protein